MIINSQTALPYNSAKTYLLIVDESEVTIQRRKENGVLTPVQDSPVAASSEVTLRTHSYDGLLYFTPTTGTASIFLMQMPD